MVLSYIEHFIVPVTTFETVVTAAKILFPKHKELKLSLERYLYGHLSDPQLDLVPGLGLASVSDGVAEVLASRCVSNSLVINEDFIAEVARCVVYLILETVKGTNTVRQDGAATDLGLVIYAFPFSTTVRCKMYSGTVR